MILAKWNEFGRMFRDEELRGLAIFCVLTTSMYLYPVVSAVCKHNKLTVHNHHHFRRFEIGYYLCSFTLVVYAINGINRNYSNP